MYCNAKNIVAATKCTVLVSVIFTMLMPNTNAGCSVNFDKMRKRRIEAIRGQILSKLGLTQLPNNEAAPDNSATQEVERMYNRTRDFVLEQARQKRDECKEPDESYYAQDIITVNMKTLQPTEVGQLGTARGYKATRVMKQLSEFFHFDLKSYQLDPNTIMSVNLRLYQVHNPEVASGERQQVQLYQLFRPEQEGMIPAKRFLDMRLMDTYGQGWASFDVTSSVQEWVRSSETNQGFELTIPCSDEETGGTKTNSGNEAKKLNIVIAGSSSSIQHQEDRRGDHQPDEITVPELGPEYNPHLVIMVRTPAAQSKSHQSNNHRRRKRALDADYCFRRNPSETNCCLRELFIDFRKDLGWKWIHAPSGYKANFCGGACPYLWSMDSHHATILSLYKSMNPRASSAPCCTAKELEPLTIMYYNEGKYKVTQMSDMVLLSCKCS